MKLLYRIVTQRPDLRFRAALGATSLLLLGYGVGAMALSGDCVSKEARYAIYSHGFNVGQLTATRAFVSDAGGRVLHFRARTHVDADFLVYSYKLQNEEEALVAETGTLRYHRTTRENGANKTVEGHLDGTRFVIDISENGVGRRMVVEKGRYDHTTMECPEIGMKHTGDEMTLRLLDLETLMVVNRHYRWVKDEDVTIDGRRLHCRVVDFEDCNKKCRRWIAPDEAGALVVRQDGSGKDGSYSLRLTRLGISV